MNPESNLDPTDDRFALLDWITERIPELDLSERQIDWATLPDGAEALLVDGGGVDGGNGAFFASAGQDLHVVGSLAPLAPGCVGSGCLPVTGPIRKGCMRSSGRMTRARQWQRGGSTCSPMAWWSWYRTAQALLAAPMAGTSRSMGSASGQTAERPLERLILIANPRPVPIEHRVGFLGQFGRPLFQ